MRSAGAWALSLAMAVAGRAAAEAADALTLAELLEGMATAKGVVAEFTERKEIALLVAPLESRGRLYFVPPGRLARFTTSPGFSSLVVDGDTVRFREGAEGDELDLSGNPMARVFVDNFIVLWSGDREKLEELYEPQLSSDGDRWRLVLVPRHPPLDRFIERIVLKGEGRAIATMEVRERDGDRTTTVFDSVETDHAFAAAELERLFGEGRPLEGAAGGR
jgi:hypothetical protein